MLGPEADVSEVVQSVGLGLGVACPEGVCDRLTVVSSSAPYKDIACPSSWSVVLPRATCWRPVKSRRKKLASANVLLGFCQ